MCISSVAFVIKTPNSRLHCVCVHTQVNLEDEHGSTALHIASELGLGHLCRFLVTNGSDPSIRSSDGAAPIDQAMATVTKVFREEPIKGDSEIESQLLEAAKNGDLDLVKVCVCWHFQFT